MSGIIANDDLPAPLKSLFEPSMSSSGKAKSKIMWGRISLLAGYAGTDFLENLYKLRFAQFFKV